MKFLRLISIITLLSFTLLSCTTNTNSNKVSPPTITDFATSDATIVAGQETTLNWSITGTSLIELSIDKGIGNVSGESSIAVSPTSKTTYTLTASNSLGSASKTVTVDVTAAPVKPTINSFTVADQPILSGEETLLNWSIAGTAPITLSINQGIGTVSGTSRSVSPTSTTTYTLTATNSLGSDSQTVTLNVTPTTQPVVQAPSITNFSSLEPYLLSGQSTNLKWSVTGSGPVNLTIDQGIGDVSNNTSNSGQVSPTSNTTYTITASNSAGFDSKTLTINVYQPATYFSSYSSYPIISDFSDLCLDVQSSSTADSANVIQWQCSNSDNQLWTFQPTTNGQYTIEASHSSKMLDRADNGNVLQWSANGVEKQNWNIFYISESDAYKFVSPNNDICLTVEDLSLANGGNISHVPCDDSPTQLFRLYY